ncbi:MAG: hypothetical protein J0H49_18545 [Acidobacteria bacterium]|nr:hypothetical protein [Acidobacteriota bacterium]
MRNERPGDKLKAIWHDQPTEMTAMTSKLIQMRARDLRAKTRKKLIGTIAGPIAVGVCYALGLWLFPRHASMLHPLFLLALGWSLCGLYFLNRAMWSSVVPGDAGPLTGLEFCRAELGRRRQLLGRLLLWSLGPLLLSLGTFILAIGLSGTPGHSLLPNGLPFLVLTAVWIVVYFGLRVKEQRELRMEIEELEEIGRAAG